MPKLSDTMEEGTILRWLKKEGDTITAGEVIAEVETDKADMELEATASGTLAAIEVKEGESAAVGAVLARVEGGDGARREEKPRRDDDGGGVRAEEARPSKERRRDAEGEGDEPATRRGDERGGAARDREAGAVKSSPSARQLAEEHGIDLGEVRGSGPGGRIVKDDVAGAIERRRAPARGRAAEEGREAGGRAAGEVREPRGERDDDRARAPRPTREDGPARAGVPVAERHALSRMRRSIAKRMTESFRDVPHFAVTTEIDMSEAVRLKEALKTSGAYVTAPTYTHMVLRATALALRKHPRLNASYRDDAVDVHADVNLGMAVAVEDGLIVPILRHVDELGLEEIAAEARRLAEQAAQGRFASADLSGGTFTVSNLGMFDIDSFTAVINPPQAGILAVGAIKERAVVRSGQVVVARTMRVTLSCDHRVVDGVVASKFLEDLKQLLESPIVLVVHGR